MSDYNWSRLDETLKRLEYHCHGLLVDGQSLERSRGAVLLPLDWLKKLVDVLDLREVRAAKQVTPPPVNQVPPATSVKPAESKPMEFDRNTQRPAGTVQKFRR